MTSLRSILTLFFDWSTVQVLATGAGRLGGIQYHRPRFRDDFLSERAVTDERNLFEHGKKVYAAVLATVDCTDCPRCLAVLPMFVAYFVFQFYLTPSILRTLVSFDVSLFSMFVAFSMFHFERCQVCSVRRMRYWILSNILMSFDVFFVFSFCSLTTLSSIPRWKPRISLASSSPRFQRNTSTTKAATQPPPSSTCS